LIRCRHAEQNRGDAHDPGLLRSPLNAGAAPFIGG
jgi:hypothetical protein